LVTDARILVGTSVVSRLTVGPPLRRSLTDQDGFLGSRHGRTR
jgi:hypothetical protein